MKIIMDAMGGDNAPSAIVRGAVAALQEFDIDITLVGDEGAVRRELAACGAEALRNSGRLTIVHTDEIITMEDDPFSVVRKKKHSSMTVALKLLAAGEADAFVGAGNTGALYLGAAMLVRPYPGIKRAALAAILPFERPLLLLDCGANVTVTPAYLEQFAMMGSVYMERIFRIPSPAVGLLNNGAEAHKGTPIQTETYQLLKNQKSIRFIGNIEGSDITTNQCDVLVTDGFTGNIALKMTEGMGRYFMHRLKGVFFAGTLTKMSAILLRGQLVGLKKSLDASEYGGSPFLGISKPVIKAHGSSDAKAVKNAIRQAIAYMDTGIGREIEKSAAAMKPVDHTNGTKQEELSES